MDHCDKNREIDQIRDDLKEIRGDVKILIKKVEHLRVKASIWGALGGIVALMPIIIGLIVHIAKAK
jgi:hypothetical protein